MNSFAKRCSVAVVLSIAVLLPQFKTLKTSEEGLALIAGLEGCRTSPYQCSAGVWTNGIGHTAGVTQASMISERTAAVNLVYDVMRVERAIERCMPVSMPQGVYDVVISFAFNVGTAAACSSTLAKFINQKQWLSACSQLSRWVYVKGTLIAGLVNRRATETTYCLKAVS